MKLGTTDPHGSDRRRRAADRRITLSPGETRLMLLALGKLRSSAQMPIDVDVLAARLAYNIEGGAQTYQEGQRRS